jgi:polysaccharide export outer membrane protein
MIPGSRLRAQDAPQMADSQPQAAAPLTPELQQRPNPLEEMRNFEPPVDLEYRLGKGDEITVDFSGRPEMQAKLVVGPDGRITLPLAGDLQVDDMTRQDAAKSIETALAPYYENLSAQVTVTKYTANRILVLGAVATPGMVTFEGTPTLLEALTRSGMEPGVGPDKSAQLPERCAIYRGQDQVLWVDVRKLVNSGNGLADLRLRRDDVVYVPSVAERYVSVLGQVQKPGAVPLDDSSTLASVLADAGGFTEKAGNKPHIQIVDPTGGTSRTISMNDVLNPAKSLEVTLHPGEIIYVPQTGFSKVLYAISGLSPLITAATFGMVGAGVL